MPGNTVPVLRYAVLTEGYLADPSAGKTAHGVIRFRSHEIACVIDSAYAGKTVREVVPSLPCSAPIVATVNEALDLHPTAFLIGVATHGGALPAHLRAAVLVAIDAGLEIVNGLHQFLNDDVEFVEHARRSGARLWDVRAVGTIPLFTGAAYRVPQQIVLAVGSDCAVGKMTTMLEIERAAHAVSSRAEFIATGQTGIMIAGWGTCVDRVISDFVTGAAEQLVLGASPQSDVLLVEGQGAIFHPAYAPVTFGLLYGTAPDALLLCHRPNTTHIDGFSNTIAGLPELIDVHERILRSVKPAKVAAVALDTSALDAAAAARAIQSTQRETGLPADDPVRNGGGTLWKAIVAALAQTHKAQLTARA
ncbi:MAG TPA: DUF1611 domain-containing protein [Candidatus Baltobacteraceae bacterium]|jgi:uncharacterized NAD-dependent epimerase/dehydratase family protein|nr:DUF1611 domain-containing protein [Candidatus Baltobacteraceae bacterium]